MDLTLCHWCQTSEMNILFILLICYSYQSPKVARQSFSRWTMKLYDQHWPAHWWGEGLFLAPLQTFRYISRTAGLIVTKLSVPSRASILHIVTKFFLKAMIGCLQMTPEWRHFLPFSAQKNVSREELSGLQLWRYRKTFIIRDVRLLGLQNCYLEILNFWNFDPQK